MASIKILTKTSMNDLEKILKVLFLPSSRFGSLEYVDNECLITINQKLPEEFGQGRLPYEPVSCIHLDVFDSEYTKALKGLSTGAVEVFYDLFSQLKKPVICDSNVMYGDNDNEYVLSELPIM